MLWSKTGGPFPFTLIVRWFDHSLRISFFAWEGLDSTLQLHRLHQNTVLNIHEDLLQESWTQKSDWMWSQFVGSLRRLKCCTWSNYGVFIDSTVLIWINHPERKYLGGELGWICVVCLSLIEQKYKIITLSFMNNWDKRKRFLKCIDLNSAYKKTNICRKAHFEWEFFYVIGFFSNLRRKSRCWANKKSILEFGIFTLILYFAD